ncbi:MAG: DUF2244 domain-containing protein [Pseudomonadota bacterium]
MTAVASDANPITKPEDAPILDAVITPHRSLGPRGFSVFMIVLGGLSFASGVLFLSLGAWPVLGFFGLDVLLVYVAFRWSFASGEAREVVRISHGHVYIAQHDRKGRIEAEADLNPYWARLVVSRDEDRRVTRMGLKLHDRLYPIAGALSPEERTSFAKVVADALEKAKQ